jgi:hypothetical protein
MIVNSEINDFLKRSWLFFKIQIEAGRAAKHELFLITFNP